MAEAKAEIEKQVLALFKDDSANFDSIDLANKQGWKHTQLIGVLNSLQADSYVVCKKKEQRRFDLTEEAQSYLKEGSPEFLVFQSIPAEGVSMKEVSGTKQGKIGLSKCMENKWVNRGDGMVTRAVDSVTDVLQEKLERMSITEDNETLFPPAEIKVLKKRKLVSLVSTKSFQVSKGPNWAPERKKAVADLTKEMLDDGSWETATLKPVNFHAIGQTVASGYLHPLMRVRTEFRKILIGMGFEEMPTNQWVESSFWNFDSLFQPQQHPARDAHDTFFLKYPKHSTLKSVDEEYVKLVQKTHEEGGFDSLGYRYDWSLDEAKTNLLRTHTTAVSAQMLYKLAQQDVFKPQKYFSIDRVFRNETVDATHLAEFHQVEGLVADYDLTLGDLIGVIETFFKALGIEKLRFKPAFNPYTEPSMEVFGYHPTLKKWTEVGNSGMFRPEMLRPMGLPANVRVIAWGLSLERPTMIKYDVDKITSLFGHKINLQRNQSYPVAKFP